MYTINISYPFFHAMASQAAAEFPTANNNELAEEIGWFRLWAASQVDVGLSYANAITLKFNDDAIVLGFPREGSFIALMRSVSAAYQQWLGNGTEATE